MTENQELSAYYERSLDHLLDQLARIDLKIRIRILQLRRAGPAVLDEFQGLYISEEEVDALLASDPTTGAETSDIYARLRSLREHLTGLEARIARGEAQSPETGVELRLVQLASGLGLSAPEVDVLLICLAPELDLRYERLDAYLQNDVTKRRPTADLVLSLICPSFQDKLKAREYLAPQSALLRWHLLRVLDDPTHHPMPLLARSLKADDRIVDYLLGSDHMDVRLSGVARLVNCSGAASDLSPASRGYRKLPMVAGKNAVFYLQGPNGAGRKRAAQTFCAEMGKRLFIVDLPRALKQGLPFEVLLRLAQREALLQDALLYCDHFDILLEQEHEGERQAIITALEVSAAPVFLAAERGWHPANALHEVPFIAVSFPIPDYDRRQQLWMENLNGHFPVDDSVDVSALANKFQFSEGQIRDAVTTARNLALSRGSRRMGMADLYQACRVHSNQRLTELARKISPHYTWDDIVLPPDQLAQLREIVSTLRHRPLVYGQWGFDRKLSLGKGISGLFAGPSGTGKTMAAEIMAGELSLDLYQIDLSMVVSKYIGETEKNLSRVFREAETSNCILFFDEADALFGKRSEVRDAHDRYANIEISYLLQKVEEYEGMVILATNLRQNLDEAFIRRLQFIVEFPFPDEEYRRRIWEATFPREAPRSDDIDLDFLAHQFRLAGGSIRNVILGGAFLAAQDGRVITMAHLIRATRRELQKMGKMMVEGDFGPYYGLVSSHPGSDHHVSQPRQAHAEERTWL